jgi:hypothetical protein
LLLFSSKLTRRVEYMTKSLLPLFPSLAAVPVQFVPPASQGNLFPKGQE